MNSIFGAYLEDYHLVKLIIPTEVTFDEKDLKILGHQKVITLRVFQKEYFGNECHLSCNLIDNLILHNDYYVFINSELTYHLSLGKITRTSRFDDENYYDGPLGVEYHQEYCVFRIWTPVAKEIFLILNHQKYIMNYLEKGCWHLQVDGNYDGAPYYYQVRINETFEDVLDPYMISCNANAKYGYVVDLSQTYQMKNTFYHGSFDNPYQHSIIYEANVRDLTSNVKGTGQFTYLGIVENTDILTYLKDLGITHLQLMPVFTFGGVDEKIKIPQDLKFKYNWGYNPIAYNVPSGWYASNPDNPYARINELKILIDTIHQKGLAVNLDVVFNHVYQHETFSWGRLVPGYVYRTDAQGFLMNSSFCGNDIATEHRMIRKFILDSLNFWQTFYRIDGFRFDLMGLIDLTTIKSAQKILTKHNPSTMLYGEGWVMETNLGNNNTGSLINAKLLAPVAFFNDYFRNTMRGSFYDSFGFITGKALSGLLLNKVLNEGCLANFTLATHHQSINYIECHDNRTLLDQLRTYKTFNHEEERALAIFGLSLVVLSQGIPFIHAGQELMKTKQGIDNSYNLGDDINHMPWENRFSEDDLSLILKELIKLRQQLPYYISEFKTQCFCKHNYYEVRYQKNHLDYQMLIKNDFEETIVYFAPGTINIFDGLKIVQNKCESFCLKKPGIYIFNKNEN